MRIAMIPFDVPYFTGDTVFKFPLGGVEHSFTFLARELAREGCEVTVFNALKGGDYDGVEYVVGWGDYRKRWKDFDICLIANALPLELLDWIDWKRAIFWQHQPCLYVDLEVLKKFVAFVCISRFQQELMIQEGLPRKQTVVIGHGVDNSMFDSSTPRNNKALVYHSVPNRGLELLLDMLDDLVAIEPDIRIRVCSDWGIYWDKRRGEVEIGNEEKLRDEHVEFIGSVPFPRLAEILSTSYIHAYPAMKLDETFCLTVLQAQAAGLPVVTTRAGALAETARKQITIAASDLNPGGNKVYRKNYLRAVDRLLHDEKYWEFYHLRALKFARANDWGIVVKKWMRLFDGVLSEESCSNQAHLWENLQDD